MDLICEKCGKPCSSKSGLTLHLKTCKGQKEASALSIVVELDKNICGATGLFLGMPVECGLLKNHQGKHRIEENGFVLTWNKDERFECKCGTMIAYPHTCIRCGVKSCFNCHQKHKCK